MNLFKAAPWRISVVFIKLTFIMASFVVIASDACTSDQFKCWRTSVCIQNTKVCDGVHDCFYGEDEPLSCNINECLDHNGHCQQICSDLPASYKCSCNAGFTLADDQRTCVADCIDPGTPAHGYRQISSADGGFPVGTVVYFHCNAHYKLSGAKKIVCSKGQWSGKKPTCQSQGCPMPPPTFAYAHVTTNPVSNTKGSYVNYACDLGYVSDHRPTRLLCDKDPKTLGYKWSGNFSCQKVRCGPPPAPKTGHGNASITSNGSTTHASYHCYPGYVLLDYRHWIVETVNTSCDQSGIWSIMPPTCVKTCSASDVDIEHGYVKSMFPQYMATGKYFYTQNVVVTFTCRDRHRLQGYPKRRCLESGFWSGTNPHCVISSCESPLLRLANGRVTSNYSDTSQFPIWTVVTFTCNAGYRLVGPRQRQCWTDGLWTERHNPTCQKLLVTCPPAYINHGKYEPVKQTYMLNEMIVAVCDNGYYLWGESKRTCSSASEGESGSWLPTTADSYYECLASKSCLTECLKPAIYEERCKESGTHARIIDERMHCEKTEEQKSRTARNCAQDI